MSMIDLFTKEMEVCLHKATNTEIIIRDTEWHKGQIHYNCLVPEKDHKGKLELCNATYGENEIEIITNPKRIRITEI